LQNCNPTLWKYATMNKNIVVERTGRGMIADHGANMLRNGIRSLSLQAIEVELEDFPAREANQSIIK
jgi:hypothetical protein